VPETAQFMRVRLHFISTGFVIIEVQESDFEMRFPAAERNSVSF
jgi:hypothetical protein